jgi:hypothetical protein
LNLNLNASAFVADEDWWVYFVVVDNQVYTHLCYYYYYYANNLNRMNTVQDRQMQDVQYHHNYNMLLVLDAVVEDKMFGIVVVVEDEIHFGVEIVLNQIDDIVYDDDVIVVDDVAVVVVDGDDDEMMIVVVEMDDDFVHFVLVVYWYHLIVLLNDHSVQVLVEHLMFE